MRKHVIKKIVDGMSIPGFKVAEVKSKIRNLKSTYYQEKKKIGQSKASGSSADNVYAANIKWFFEMKALLKDADERRNTFDNVSRYIIYIFIYYLHFSIHSSIEFKHSSIYA